LFPYGCTTITYYELDLPFAFPGKHEPAIWKRQAMMLSFNDIYRILCVLMLVLVPTFLFLKRDTRNLPAEAAH